MLASSREDLVRLLPALPTDWPAGSIRGVLLRGGIRVEHLAWSRDLVEAELVCVDDRELTVSVHDQVRATLPARAGRALRLSFP
jgi:alpha-L-fucosidase 2